jgi:hypothetical protein
MTHEYDQSWSESISVPNINNVNNRKLYLRDMTHEYSQCWLESIYVPNLMSPDKISLLVPS